MSLISRTINQLFGGVSQQPPQLRADGQCEVMDNCWPDAAVGLAKRPPSVYGAKLNSTSDSNTAVHFINRDLSERYTVLVRDGEIKVYDLDTGAEKTVTYSDGTSYLQSASPKDDFSFLTVADTTFVVNRTVPVAMDSLPSAYNTVSWAKVQLLAAPTHETYLDESDPPVTLPCVGASFDVTVNGVTYSSTTAGWTVAQHVVYLTSVIAAANPSLSVVSNGVDTITITSGVGATLGVGAVVLDEYKYRVNILSPWKCGLTANTSKVYVTRGGFINGHVGFVTVLAGVARQSYTVLLNGSGYSFTVAADGSNAKTTDIAAGLAAAIPAGSYIVSQMGSTLKIQRTDGSQFTIASMDSYGDLGMIAYTDSVESQAQLPPTFWQGIVLKIRGESTLDASPYYVTYVGDRWVETVAPGLPNRLTAATMPHKLVRQSDGTFTFGRIEWAEREVGDLESNPPPSFVGNTISNIFFYRERLGLLSGENVVMSRATAYYNFWATTVSSVLDDDPIDVTVADTRVSKLYHAVPFQESLLLFADTAQFQLSGADVLSPKTARLDATTRFHSNKKVAPVAAGRDVYFAVDRGGYTSMREYFMLPDGINSDAADVTAHVPSYVPNELVGLTGSSLVDALVMFSSREPSKLYFHKFLWAGEQKVQSAWGTITLDSTATIIGAEYIDTVLWCVVSRSDGTYLEYMDFRPNRTEEGMGFQVYLDRRYSLTGVYNSSTKKTTWTLPNADTVNSYVVVLGAGWGNTAGSALSTTKVSSTAIEAVGDFSANPCFVGVPYTMTFRFSEIYIKDAEKSPVNNGRLMLRNMKVEFSNTNFFKGVVTPYLRETSEYTFNGSYLGTASAVIGRISLSSGSFKFPIITENRGAVIELVNDSHLPSTFQSAAWEGSFTPRSKRV